MNESKITLDKDINDIQDNIEAMKIQHAKQLSEMNESFRSL